MSVMFTQTFIGLITGNKESEAYQFLHKQYYHTLLQFATAYLKAKEPAEEIVSDVLYRVWLKKEQVAEINNIRVYLFTAVRNACLTLIAKQKREHELMEQVLVSSPGSTSDDPESLIISAELYERIRQTINKLPPRCKIIYEMVRLEGLRNKDVAQKLDISVNTIDVQLAIALKRLVHTVNLYNQQVALRDNCR